MVHLFLTPASISYLNQMLLSLVMTIYFGYRLWRLRRGPTVSHDIWLTIFLATVTGFSLSLFLDVSLLPAERLPVVYLQNTLLGLMMLALIHFAYFFPAPRENQKTERVVVMLISLAYTLWEAGFALWRFVLLARGRVEFRPEYMDYVPVLEFLWVIFVFIRGTVHQRAQPAARRFALVFTLPFLLALINLLSAFNLVSTPVYHISLSVGILLTLFLFAFNYLAAKPEVTSLTTKFSGAILTSVLSVFGILAWLVTPAYAQQYRPHLVDQRTLHFSPNPQGGFDVTQRPFHFETELGENLRLAAESLTHVSTREIGFDFPFYGKRYRQVFISEDGILTFGEALRYEDLEVQLSALPAILPLTLDLDPGSHPGAGVFAREAAGQLVVTYFHLRAFNHLEDEYTFQVILDHDGSFDLTYAGLPQPQSYYSNDRPEASVWALGVKPGFAREQTVDFTQLPLTSGAEGLIQDEYASFRLYLHQFLLPLALAVLVSSLLFLVGLPLALNSVLIRPFNRLYKGVVALNEGQIALHIPVRANDEIGFLTQAFNDLSSQLSSLVKYLEARVDERTADLLAANERLRQLSIAVEQSPSAIIITDLQANIEYVNPAFTNSTGYTFEEIQGENPRLLKSGLTPPGTFVEMWSSLTGGKIWRGELCNRKKNGVIFWEQTVIAPIYDEAGLLTHYVSIKEDITERKKAENALRESEKQYRDLFELESDAIFIIRNEDGAILEANSAASTLYGYSHAELITLSNTDLLAEPETTQPFTQLPVPIDQVLSLPLRWHRKKDQTLFPVEITARFILWKGEVVHLAAVRDNTERRHAEQELERLATTDPLTGIFNRRHFFAEGEKLFQRSLHQSTDLAAMMVDLDHFKAINDTYGHSLGDLALCAVTLRLQDNLRATDLLARYGGEEFVILLPHTGFEDACRIADRLLKAISGSPVLTKGQKIQLSMSLGIAQLTYQTTSLDELLREADQGLYLAKQGGRNRWAVVASSSRETPSEGEN
jgi:diguanylate cyclase (GGDEF)-like protein/PAS domain S-box-containing protein